MVLRTARLVLREMLPGDIDFIAPLLADPEVMRFWPRPHTFEEAEEWITRQMERYERDGCGYWLALMDGRPVGQAGLMRQDVDGLSEIGLGYIFARDYWGMGLAAEAARGCLDYGFSSLGLSRIVCLIRPGNEASVRVTQRLGMIQEKRVMYADYEHAVFVALQ